MLPFFRYYALTQLTGLGSFLHLFYYGAFILKTLDSYKTCEKNHFWFMRINWFSSRKATYDKKTSS